MTLTAIILAACSGILLGLCVIAFLTIPSRVFQRRIRKLQKKSPNLVFTLTERLKRLGFEATEGDIPQGFSDFFQKTTRPCGCGPPSCPRCHGDCLNLTSTRPELHHAGLGMFCLQCGYGQLREESSSTRHSMNQPSLEHAGNLFEILLILEEQDQEFARSREGFVATIQGTGDFRTRQFRVRVDPIAKTVVQVETPDVEAWEEDPEEPSSPKKETALTVVK